MSLSAPRDVIQISLGSSANAVTAHSLNLQGLAATDNFNDANGNDQSSTCDPQTTHTLERNRWVPRVLMVDEPTHFFVNPQVSQQASLFAQQPAQQQLQHQLQHQPPDWNTLLSSSASPFAIQALDPALSFQHAQPQLWSGPYSQTSSALAYSTHSRYYQTPDAVPSSYRPSDSNPRHVNWDEDEQEPEQEEERPREREARLYREREVWQRDTLQPLQDQLNHMVQDSPIFSAAATDDSTNNNSRKPLHWMDYWMPPYSSKSKVALPFSRQSHLTPHWDSYFGGNELSNWKDEALLDGLRHLLEACDACQGVLITTQGHGMYAGLTTALLQELQEESKNAIRMVFHVTNPDQEDASDESTTTKDEAKNNSSNNKESSGSSNDDQPSGWQPAHVNRLRQHVSSGMALYDFSQNAHMVVPLQLPNADGDSHRSLFNASAKLAMALESCTLPVRLQNSSDSGNSHRAPNHQIGLLNAPFFGQGGSDSRWGSTAQQLSMSEFLTCVQPSSQYKILELDSMGGSNDNAQIWQAFRQGTSIERDVRMREGGRDASRFRSRDVSPGVWLQDTSRGGLLSSLSPNPSKAIVDRSLHHHFALSTAVRPVLQDELSNYLTALVQGMGIQYRPERSMSTVLNQTIGQLTQSNGYGAGAYWKSLTSLEQPVVAVLGNSTRSYHYLHQVATDMKLVLGSRYRGYYQRDLVNGVLPEAEDCQEALEGCWDLRDVYHPPDGSGLVDDDDGDIDY